MALLRDIDRINLTNGTVCFVLSLTAPLAILLAASRQAGLSEQQISGIVFAGYGIGGFLTIVCSLVTRKPYAILWTIPGVTLLADALGHMALAEAAGAFVVSGLLAIALGASGCMAYVMRMLPTPVVMGMLAGVFLPYGVGLFPAFAQDPYIGLATVIPFIVASAIPMINRSCPPLLAALIGGGIYLALSSDSQAYKIESEVFAFTTPEIIIPVFTVRSIVELVLPITATVIGIHNAQAFVLLGQRGHEPAVTELTVTCGAASLLFALFGCVPATMASLICAITTASGETRRQYVSTVVFGALVLVLGLLAPLVIAAAVALPSSFSALLAGLAMLRILQDAFSATFTGNCRLGGLVALLIPVSGLTPLGIGSAFWALIAGYSVSWLLERAELRSLQLTNR